MARDGSNGRKPEHRAFRPTLDGTLEPRLLMAAKASASAFVRSQTAAGGQAVVVTLASKEQFYISVVNGGTIRAVPASRGRIGLIVSGSSVDTQLTINPIVKTGFVAVTNSSTGATTQQVASAHVFNNSLSNQFRLLNIASIRVKSGTIGAIEGYRVAILSGPITVKGTNRVDRIAFDSIARGGSISVGGDLNTLDILNNADFNTGAGLDVGRDLNWMSVGQDLTFQNGASATIGRDVGLSAQAAKGSGPGGQGIQVNGNFTVGPNSSFRVGRSVDAFVTTNGNLSGVSRIFVGGVPLQASSAVNAFQVRGSVTA